MTLTDRYRNSLSKGCYSSWPKVCHQIQNGCHQSY